MSSSGAASWAGHLACKRCDLVCQGLELPLCLPARYPGLSPYALKSFLELQSLQNSTLTSPAPPSGPSRAPTRPQAAVKIAAAQDQARCCPLWQTSTSWKIPHLTGSPLVQDHGPRPSRASTGCSQCSCCTGRGAAAVCGSAEAQRQRERARALRAVCHPGHHCPPSRPGLRSASSAGCCSVLKRLLLHGILLTDSLVEVAV